MDLLEKYESVFYRKSRKFDILAADVLMLFNPKQAIELYSYTNNEANYSFEQNDEYDLNRLKHCSQMASMR